MSIPFQKLRSEPEKGKFFLFRQAAGLKIKPYESKNDCNHTVQE